MDKDVNKVTIMKLMKEKILYIIILIIIVLIVGFTIFIVKSKNSIEKYDMYGKWLVDSTQDFVNNEIYYSREGLGNNYIVINKSDIEICYYRDNNLICERSNYIVKDNTIIIDENEVYLSGTNEFYIENGCLLLKRVITENEYVLMILKREDSNKK